MGERWLVQIPAVASELTIRGLAAFVAATNNYLTSKYWLGVKNWPGYERFRGAGDGTRTRDSLLGKQVLYQLSYPRVVPLSIRRAESAVYRWDRPVAL